jgi:hypothetical protein
MITDLQLQTAIDQEEARRRELAASHQPYRYWQERGDDQPPYKELWCSYCQGFYGVAHTHYPGEFCWESNRARAGNRQCACIDCVVAAALYHKTASSK